MRHGLKSLLIVAAVMMTAFSAGFAFFTSLVFTLAPDNPASGEAIVVLTGGESRIREGMRLFANGVGRRILISGVNLATTRKDLIRQADVDPLLFDCCVDVDQRARDTIGNASETKAWAEPWGFRRLIVVTSNYHMPRSLLILKRAMPDVELVPHPVVSRYYTASEWWHHPSAVKLLMVEYVKSIPAAAKIAVSDAFRRLIPRPQTPITEPILSLAPSSMTGL